MVRVVEEEEDRTNLIHPTDLFLIYLFALLKRKNLLRECKL